MATVSLQKAQAELGELLIRAEAGEEIVIERENMPPLRLAVVPGERETSAGSTSGETVLGYGSFAYLRGKIPDEFFFDSLPEEDLKLWEGGDRASFWILTLSSGGQLTTLISRQVRNRRRVAATSRKRCDCVRNFDQGPHR